MYDDDSVEHDDEEPMGGFRSRIGTWLDKLSGRTPDDEEYEEPVSVAAPRATATAATTLHVANGGTAAGLRRESRDNFRIASASRESSITIAPVTSFADVQKVADRLKSGEPQIVNLEKTPADVAERLIDFLNGVTYALDGYVEKVSEGAYLFTPSFIPIHAEGPESLTSAAAPRSLFERL